MSVFAKLSHKVAAGFLRVATHIFTAASNAAVVDTVLQVIHRLIDAIAQSLGGAAVIWMGIFTNGINEATLHFILNHLYDLFRFLYDLVKPANVISGENNPYNEFDLRIPDNRFAVIYQVQRVALTLTAILKIAWERTPPNELDDIEINVSLSSDFDDNGNPLPASHVSELKEGQLGQPNEEWLFINGVAVEFVWFKRSCDKVRDTFKRKVKGIYNRTDGILWDLIECAGERSVAGSNALIHHTKSSMAAQATLVHELRDALWPPDRSAPDKVVVIAHSQGCLVLRLALQELVRQNPNDPERRDMKERLRVFTFANPSIDWRVMDAEEKSLSEYTRTTEHFAHETDFVAMLGIVTHWDDQDSGYDRSSVYYSKRGKGHLLGAHYPLEAGAYVNGTQSSLFQAVGGVEIA